MAMKTMVLADSQLLVILTREQRVCHQEVFLSFHRTRFIRKKVACNMSNAFLFFSKHLCFASLWIYFTLLLDFITFIP